LPAQSTTPAHPPWPQVASGCGGSTFVPVVDAEPLRAPTGLHVLVGPRLYRVDVDAGRAKVPAGLPAGAFAGSVVDTGAGTYASLNSCDENGYDSPATVVRLPAGGPAQVVGTGPYGQLLAGGAHPWGVIWQGGATGRITLDPLDGGPRLRLPRYFNPLAGSGTLVVGLQYSGNPDRAGVLEVLDPGSGAVRVRLGRASSVAVGSGLVVWAAAGCSRCAVHTYALATGARARLPRTLSIGVGLWGGAVSPDGRQVAFTRQSPRPGPYATDHPGNPNEVAVLNLRTGRVQSVGGLLLWSKAAPGLGFSPDGKWLTILLDEGTGTRLLVWRPGWPGVRDTLVPLPGSTAYGVSVTALP
jgi:hypothetical protein